MSRAIKKNAAALTAILAVVLWLGVSWAEKPGDQTSGKLSASLDAVTATIGSVVTVTLNGNLPEGVQFPKDIEIQGLEGLSEIERTMGPDQVRIKLLVDRLGAWKSGPVTLTYLDQEGKKQILTAAPLSLTVASNLGDKPSEATVRPLEDIFAIKPLWYQFLPWLVGGAGCILVASAILWWRKRRRGETVFPDIESPAHIRARSEIEQLEARGLFDKGHVKAFYFDFSEIIRRYLEALRHFPAAEFTTEEISRNLHHEEDRALLPLLRRADLVKFSDAVPSRSGKEEDVKKALAYIHATTPVQADAQGDPSSGEVNP